MQKNDSAAQSLIKTLDVLCLNMEMMNRTMNVDWKFRLHRKDPNLVVALGVVDSVVKKESKGCSILGCIFNKNDFKIEKRSISFSRFFKEHSIDAVDNFLNIYPEPLWEGLITQISEIKTSSAKVETSSFGKVIIRDNEWLIHPEFKFKIRLCSLSSDGMTVANVILPAGTSIPTHKVPQLQKIYVIKGGYYDPFNGAVFLEGDLQILPPNQYHSMESKDETLLTITWVPPLSRAYL